MNNEEKYDGYCTHADGPWGSRPIRDIEAYEMAVQNASRLATSEGDMSDIKLALNYPAGTITWFGWRWKLGCLRLPLSGMITVSIPRKVCITRKMYSEKMK